VPTSLPLLNDQGARARLAIAQKGFRPFFLLASLFAIAVVPFWVLVLLGIVTPVAYLDPITWHAHEMIFGFSVGVIAGFLLTAVGNWTHRETLVGAPLLALAALWALGRLAMLFASALPRGVPALVDLAFLPALMLAVARPLVAAKSRKNFVMVGVLGALFAANVAVHLEALGVAAIGAARQGERVAIDLVVLLIVVIAGRVFPMFTRNTTARTSIRSVPVLEVSAVAAMAVFTASDAIAPDRTSTAVAAAVACVLTAARAARWGTRHTARHALLWILHAGYAWIPIGLALRAAAFFAPVFCRRRRPRVPLSAVSPVPRDPPAGVETWLRDAACLRPVCSPMAATPGYRRSSPVRQMVDCRRWGGTSTSGGAKVGAARHRGY
jgi:uncharacterized protein involved in response to NO